LRMPQIFADFRLLIGGRETPRVPLQGALRLVERASPISGHVGRVSIDPRVAGGLLVHPPNR